MKKAGIIIPATLLGAMVVLSFSAPLFERLLSLSGNETDLSQRFLGPSLKHLLGTDELGRDLFIRLLYGGQVSLVVAFAAVFAAAVAGTSIGLTAGYLGGRMDALLMRLTDVLIALPWLPLLIILSSLDLSKLGISPAIATSPWISVYKMVALISLLSWTTVARLTRARALTLRQTDFVRAARALGVGGFRIVVRHIFPNLLSTIVVATTLSVGGIILLESTLSFLGLGIQPPLPSWGNMLSHAEETIWEHAELSIYPGLMIFATVVCCNFLGDALQQAREPKSFRT